MEPVSEFQLESCHSQYYLDTDNIEDRMLDLKESLKVAATKEVLI